MVPFAFSATPVPAPASRLAGFVSRYCLALNIGYEGFRCSEHISTPKNPGSERISAFHWVFRLFLGIQLRVGQGSNLQVVVCPK